MKDYRNGWGETADLGFGTPDLSGDLEWLLQSGQGDRNLIAEGLLHAYYVQIYRLCLALAGDPVSGHDLLVRTFGKAVQQAYRYRPETSLPVWFYTFLLSELRFAARQERRADLTVLVYAFADLDPGQIATLFNQDPRRVEARLAKLEKDPAGRLARAGLPPEATDDLKSGPAWREDLGQRYPAPDLDDNQLEGLAVEVVKQAEQRNLIRRRWIVLQELVLLALVALGVAGLIMASDIINTDETGSATPTSPASTVIPTRSLRQAPTEEVLVVPYTAPRPKRYPTPSPVGPSQSLPTLSEASSPLSILERMRITDQFWQTAWGDMTTILYRPPGYLGPDRTFRSQFWLSESQARIQIGPMEGPPDELWIGNQGQLFNVQFDGVPTSRSELVSGGSQKRPTMGSLGLIFDPLQILGGESARPRSWQIHLLGLEQVAGRAALVVELTDVNGAGYDRLWLDTETSFVLRHQQFRGPGDQKPVIEVMISRIAFNKDFSNQSLFDLDNPYPGEFAFDTLGRPSSGTPVLPGVEVRNSDPLLPLNSPPRYFDSSHSNVSFLYPQDFDLRSPEVMVDVYGDIHFLGKATFANPWWMVCERSPDGRWIAAVSHPILAQQSSPVVYLLDLTNSSSRIQHTLPLANVSELAFAPDGRQLALLSKGEQHDKLYLADLAAGELRMLAELDQARDMIWSPNGSRLILANKPPQLSGEAEVLIIDAATGQKVGNNRYDLFSPPTGIPYSDDSFDSWYDNFSHNGGLEECTAPPTPPLTLNTAP